MKKIDRFRKNGEISTLSRREFKPAGRLLERLLEAGEAFLAERDGCDGLLVHSGSLSKSNGGLEHNHKYSRVALGECQELPNTAATTTIHPDAQLQKRRHSGAGTRNGYDRFH